MGKINQEGYIQKRDNVVGDELHLKERSKMDVLGEFKIDKMRRFITDDKGS